MSNTPVQIYDLTAGKLIAEFSTPFQAEKAFSKGIPGVNTKHVYAIITVHKTLCVENIDVVWEDTTDEFLAKERSDVQVYQQQDGLDITPPVTQAESLDAGTPIPVEEQKAIVQQPAVEPTMVVDNSEPEEQSFSVLDEFDALEEEMKVKNHVEDSINNPPSSDEPVLDNAEFGFGGCDESELG